MSNFPQCGSVNDDDLLGRGGRSVRSRRVSVLKAVVMTEQCVGGQEVVLWTVAWCHGGDGRGFRLNARTQAGDVPMEVVVDLCRSGCPSVRTKC